MKQSLESQTRNKSILSYQDILQADDFLRWNESHGHRFTHDFFKFPGKFHPPIVENILKRLSPRAVIDPMAGVGTVAVEAKAAGLPSVSIDVDPLSLFFAQVKTTPLSPTTLTKAWRHLSAATEDLRRPQWQINQYRFDDIAPSTMRMYLSKVNARHLDVLTYWFRRYALVDYARLDYSLADGGLDGFSEAVRNFFKACLLSIIRRISNADPCPVSGLEITRHMREKFAEGYDIDVFTEFERRVRLNIERMKSYVSYLQQQNRRTTPVNFAVDDSLNIERILARHPINADLILFSPPYCNAIEYWRRHRLEYFLGSFINISDIARHHKLFIGRRAIGDSLQKPPALNLRICDRPIQSLYRTGRRVKAWQLWHYFNDMKNRIAAFHGVLPMGGHMVIVVGDSTTFGYRIPTSGILEGFAETTGFSHRFDVTYPIKNRSMQYPLKPGETKIAEESIIVMRK